MGRAIVKTIQSRNSDISKAVLLFQTNKQFLHTTLSFLIIVLLSSNIHAQAEYIDKKGKPEALWEQGKDDFFILSTTYFTISNKDHVTSMAKGYQETLEKFNNSLIIHRELGTLQQEADLLTWIAAVEIEAGSYLDALNHLKESLGIYSKLNSRPGEDAFVRDVAAAIKTMTLFVMGRNHFKEGDYESALKKFKTALKLVKKIARKRYEGGLLWEIGEVQFMLGNYSAAERYYRDALVIFRELGKKDFEARILCNMGRSYHAKGENSKALEYIDKGLEIFEKFDDKNGIMGVSFLKGRIYFDQNDKSKSLALFKKALEISHNVEYQEAIGEITEEIGDAYRGMGYLSIPVKYYKRVLNIIQEAGDSAKEGDILYTVGQLYSGMGDYEKAQEVLNEAVQIYKKHNMIYERGETLVEIGKANCNQGNYLNAIENLQEALKIFEGVSDSDSSKSFALTTLGGVYRLLGDDETAKDIENKVKGNIDRRNEWDQLKFLQQQAFNFFKEEKKDRALHAIRKILNLSKEADNKVFERMCISSIGLIYKSNLEFSKALGFYKQALEVSRKYSDKGGELVELLNIATTYDSPWLSDYPNALGYYKQALVIAKKLGNKPSEEKCLSSIGLIYMGQEKDEEAEKYLKKALLVSSEMGAQERIWETQRKLGLLACFSGDQQKAKSYFGEAIDTIESIRGKISVDKLKTSFIEDKLSVYSSMIFTLLELKEVEEAFNYVERAKSRALLDLLGNNIKFRKGKDEELSQEERKLQRRINELLGKVQNEQSQPKEKQRSALNVWNKELKKARRRYSKLLLEMKRKSPELYSLAVVNSLDLKEVQELIEPDTTLLVYYIFHDTPNDEYTIRCWAVNKNESFVSGCTVSSLPFKIKTLREKITKRHSNYDKEAKELYDLLIGPVKPYIKTKRIGISPHSELHNLPFQALINADASRNDKDNQNHFLIEEYEIFYVPSASVLKFVLEKRKEVPEDNVLAFGNPELEERGLDLPYAEEEVRKIKESYPETTLYLNKKATEEKAKQLSGDYDIIHFASHSEFNPEFPMFSCIKMAKEKNEDGRLEVHEIFNLDLDNASLVTLSACETGLGKLSKGDEMIGLTRGFIYAGTPSIVASLWKVNDKSTSDLMSLFYKNLKTHSKVEALRMAQLEMINGEVGRGIVRGVGGITASEEGEGSSDPQMTVNGSHPYFWAPFILLGDWY
tara:strand:- start:478 stop:4080 length:3603 start_codon:yes stop_codon:yes gene_type:complete